MGLAGGVAGLAVALLGVRLLIGLAPAGVPRLDWIAVDARVLAFTATLAALTSLIFGVAAALPSAGPRLTRYLRSGRPGSGTGSQRAKQRSLLVGTEVALTMLLLAAAGLLTSSLIRLHSTELGFESNGVLTMTFRRIPDVYRNVAYAADAGRRLTQRLGALPGVLDVASTSIAPLGPRGRNIPMTVDGRPDATEGALEWRVVSPNYFSLLGLPLVRGRAFTDDDISSAEPVAVINESLARRYWPDGDALGQRIQLGVFRGEVRSGVRSELAALDPSLHVAPIPREIVGIVADARELGPTTPVRRTIFLPAAGRPGLPVFLIRSDRRLSVDALRTAVRDVDPALPAPLLASLDDRMSDRVADTRFTMVLLTLFAGVALALTAVGVYGLVSWAVRSRTTEIGIRIALGADRRLVVGRVIAGGMVPVLAGLSVGAAGAVAVSRALQGLLQVVGPADPLTFGAAAAALTAVALLAAWLPAARATRIDPATVLRSE
jgi:putative ABC transport system permease protein